jgi:hypothetical protein
MWQKNAVEFMAAWKRDRERERETERETSIP